MSAYSVVCSNVGSNGDVRDLPQQDFENVINSLIFWAEEFLKKGEQDPILFFQQKIKVSENES